MLDRVDRIQMCALNASAVAERWSKLLDAEQVADDSLDALAARRVTIQVGDSLVEILEPTGPGLAQAHLDAGAGGPFALGVACGDMNGLRNHLEGLNIHGMDLGEQLLLRPEALQIPGLSILISPMEARESVGLLRNLYEATHLTDDAPRSSAEIARIFGLDAAGFVPIRSDKFGYDGTLTLFDSTRLDRVESINPFDQTKTMGRFFGRFGPSMYMCYGETDDLAAVRERAKSLAPGDWTGSDEDDDGMFLHPKALGGVMLGVSRTTHAWTWSGYPERRVPLPAEQSDS